MYTVQERLASFFHGHLWPHYETGIAECTTKKQGRRKKKDKTPTKWKATPETV